MSSKKNDFFKDMSIDQYKNLGAKVSENVEMMTGNPFGNSSVKMENIPGASLVNFTKDILDNIDLSDKKYILREKNFEELKDDEGIEGLSSSIYEVGLINPVYIQKKENGKYRIISGYRRTAAIKTGYINYGDDYSFDGKVVIIPENYSADDLEVFQINENTHREDLSILELAYRFHVASEKRKVTIEELGDEYNMSSRQVKRIKGSLNYPVPVKRYINELKLTKAEEINKLIKALNLPEEKMEEYILKVKDFSRDEMRAELKRIKANEEKPLIDVKYGIKFSSIKINESLTEEQLKEITEMIAEQINKFKK
ncbi:ParB/RepB/Spo0J family partition protein [Fusobacterium perfoetens]|uniref:ParB/RepB/Spo0J family partition protein n=1 Tax=Fusobacterium perfoetens TaxID=852 RepID=UPI001F20D4D7|nr:ParB/RepB/Spo0J family partition protein [Fusobacterium perfoetens]MCF2625937.1 ParB/RepB/Spo0J family partition protein [Fusobacterium perfoetens]